MKNNNIYSFEVVDHVPRFGHVIHYLQQHFPIAEVLSIGDVVIADEGQDRVEEICDYLDLNKSIAPFDNDLTNWDPKIFDADTDWQVLKELDSLIVYCFETKAENRFRNFTDYEWFFCYHIYDNALVELYTTRKDVATYITTKYKIKDITFPGTIGAPGDLIGIFDQG